jgi:hypothetical protein
VLVIGLVAILLPNSARATVNIGSRLESAPATANAICVTYQCTIAQLSLRDDLAWPAGLRSPTNGTVISWSIRTGPFTSPVSFRVLTLTPEGRYTGAGTSPSVVPPPNRTTRYAFPLRITSGDPIGIDCCRDPGGTYFAQNGGSRFGSWIGPLMNYASPRIPSQNNGELTVAAEIEPDSAFSIERVRSRHGRIRIAVSVPNQGVLTAGDQPSHRPGPSQRHPRKIVRPLRLDTQPGTSVLVLHATHKARWAMRASARIKLKLRIAFTPIGGSEAVQVIRARLKR